MKKKIIMCTLAGTLAIGGIGVVKAMDDDDGRGIKKNGLTNENTKNAGENMISISEAERIALKEVKGNVDEVEIEEEHGKQVYKVDIDVESEDHEVHIDAYSGEILAIEADDDEDHDKGSKAELIEKRDLISKEEAIAIALKQADGKVTKVELDEDDDHYVYEIEIKMSKNREADIEISASDGKVLEIDKEREND
ncbi:PepSY domain-containing protein [Pseudalkalibacillus salsuginis]|uniref:PepSY domain-containing protein n=1 Tax=Pseudalkalibacillus salsuginis TaxID=2910972 RepID=UPI001F2AA2E0|nr:PepSY domain-containing protein [Pseudalkalibacillus salsuginis]MCF6411346.1 PepSY domain-containing protein [Pseudalkalibacillus salsuginis]